ncbi:hypothetical protein K9N68_11200 [Kovacikia minuta CCNUW1]|uniref:hypothetical protein n=1 Tax=Kovacikia minuta TaxID=2931930 RepID=UPI001CC90C17|nr:hypothetical protein [Kovacikia minuta]UBF28386.1 hypothetical protein K9N68_11200 [Kovacikia minuta CCNUW1]
MQLLVAIVLLAVTGYILWLIWRDSKSTTDGIDRGLLAAAGGDKTLAKRLLNYTRDKYPGKSERWYVEKTIYDLERDRRRR